MQARYCFLAVAGLLIFIVEVSDWTSLGYDFKVDDGFNIKKVRVKQAAEDGALTYIASTYDPTDQIIRDGIYEGGRKIISFCGVLQHGVFPLPELLQMTQKLGS